MTETLEATLEELAPYGSGSREYDGAIERAAGRLRQQLISGGKPYILIIVDPETAQAEIEQVGFDPDRLGEALTEITRVVNETEPLAEQQPETD